MDNTEMVIYYKINGNIYGKVSSRDKIDDWPHAHPTNEGTKERTNQAKGTIEAAKRTPADKLTTQSIITNRIKDWVVSRSVGRSSVSDAKTLSDVHVVRELWYLLRYLS